MSEDDKEVYRGGRPYVLGIVALLFKLRQPVLPPALAFDEAELFLGEFEKRAGL